MLGGSTPELGRTGRLDEDTTAAVDEDLPGRVDRRLEGGTYPNEAVALYLTQRIDNLCLEFCIVALDHQLREDIFESVVLAFLAVSEIDTAKSIFFEAPNYTSKLSGFIKIAQMHVSRKLSGKWIVVWSRMRWTLLTK